MRNTYCVPVVTFQEVVSGLHVSCGKHHCTVIQFFGYFSALQDVDNGFSGGNGQKGPSQSQSGPHDHIVPVCHHEALQGFSVPVYSHGIIDIRLLIKFGNAGMQQSGFYRVESKFVPDPFSFLVFFKGGNQQSAFRVDRSLHGKCRRIP